MALFGDTLHVHVHIHTDGTEKKIDHLIKITETMAKKTEEIKTLLAEQAATISNLAGDLDRIADRLEDEPTETELEEIAADIRSKNEQLKTLADRNIVAENDTTSPDQNGNPNTTTAPGTSDEGAE